jgi:RNA polymerase sigma-70 factor (family 1)
MPTHPEHTPEFTRGSGQGNEKAFDLLFRKYYAALCLFADSYLHHEEEAKDLVQDCFIRLWEDQRLAGQPGSIRAFLYTVIRNRCIDLLRKRKTNTARQEDFSYLSGQWSEEELSEVTRSETIRRVHGAIKTLPAKMQQVFRMYYIEGKKYAEIASLLGLHYDTVRQQKARALELLKGRLLMAMLVILSRLALVI